MTVTGDVPDYTAMSDGEMVNALGDDAMKWAVAFCQMARKLGHHGIDEGWMVGWFASAIEHSNDVRRWRREGHWEPVTIASLVALLAEDGPTIRTRLTGNAAATTEAPA